MATENGESGSPHRIVVLLDGSRASRAALETAVHLAARRGAEVVGLFVEDTDLLRSAGLPFGHEIGLTSGRIRPMELAAVEQRLRRQAEEVQRLLAAAGHRHSISWSFRVSRGRFDPDTLSLTAPTDLLVIGRTESSAVSRGLRLTRRTVHIAGCVNCAVLIADERGRLDDRPIVVLYERSRTGTRALDLAAEMARDAGQELVVLLPPSTGLPPERLEDTMRERARRQDCRVGFVRLSGEDAGTLVRALRQRDGQILILSRSSRAMDSAAGRHLLDEIESPVLVVP